MVRLTSWEAEQRGLFQGTATPGQAVDWLLDKIRKLPKLPRVEHLNDSWHTWPDGEPMTITESRLSKMIADGQLPDRARVTYQAVRADRVGELEMSGHVVAYLLDTVRKTRHTLKLHGGTLVASGQGWHEKREPT